MLTINGNNITLTRGDTLTLTVNITKDGEPYVPEQTDVIRFAVSKGYDGEIGYELIKSVVIPNNTLTFTLASEDTKLAYRKYNYDVEVTHADGCVDTFLSGTLTIAGEVK